MSSAVAFSGKWRIKPSGQLPIFLRFVINSSFTKENASKSGIRNTLPNRTYLNHMMYWPAVEYNKFEREIINHMKRDDGWYEKLYQQQLKISEKLYAKGPELKRINWRFKSNTQIERVLVALLAEYRICLCAWYTQYPLDQYFEDTLEKNLIKRLPADDPNFRKYVLTFTDPHTETNVAEERWLLVKMAREFFQNKEKLSRLSPHGRAKIEKHLDKFAYIQRGLATSKPYSFNDIINRFKEIQSQVRNGADINDIVYQASQKKINDDFCWALRQVKPDKKFRRVIDLARNNSYLRNRRVEAWFNADYGASFIYAEVARRARFNPNWIMEVSVPEMLGALHGQPLPAKTEMQKRFKNYAMVVRKGETTLITDPKKIKMFEHAYFVDVAHADEIQGSMACLGGIIRGRAKVCLDKNEIRKVKRGDILVAQYTTPDFVPAMEKAAAIVADQGGLSSHAAIVSRELGVPCVIATQNGTRIIHDNDLLEVDARKGAVRILKRARKK